MTAWQPDDGELDALAHSLPAPAADPRRAEEVRTQLLASAAARPQLARRSRAPVVALAGVTLAAAAAGAIWFAGSRSAADRPVVIGPPPPPVAVAGKRQFIGKIGNATFQRVSDWPDFVVRLDDGRIAVEVATVGRDERFRIVTSDAEVELSASKIEVAARHGLIAEVAVTEGMATVHADARVIILHSGETWTAPVTASRDTIEPHPTPAPKPKHTAKPAPPANDLAPKPGEDEFRAGWTALKAGEPASAAKLFAVACGKAHDDTIAEDACFWSGAAAKRANDLATAKAALVTFVARFPKSARAPEAAALLGWMLYDAHDLDGAEAQFHAAEHDRVPKVRDSAQKGLEAIARSRGQ